MCSNYKTISIKEKKQLEKPWFTKGILQSVEQKNIIYRKFIRNKETTSKEAFLQKFKHYKNLIYINKLLRINKTNFYKSFKENMGRNKISLTKKLV